MSEFCPTHLAVPLIEGTCPECVHEAAVWEWDAETLVGDVYIAQPPARRSGLLKARLEYQGRAAPLPGEEP